MWAWNTDVTIREPGIVDRRNEPTTFGIPFSRTDNVPNTAGPCRTDGAPAYCTPIAWWTKADGSAGPVKWMLVDTQSSINRGQSLTVTVNAGGSSQSPLHVVETLDGYRIFTGPARFDLNKRNLRVFDQVFLHPNETDESDNFTEAERMVAPNNDNDLVIISARWDSQGIDGGLPYHSSADEAVYTMTVEEANPLRITVRVEGTHKAGGPGRVEPNGIYDYVLRLHFFARKSYVRAVHSLKAARNGLDDPGAAQGPPKAWPFRSYAFTTALALGEQQRFTFGTDEGPLSGSVGAEDLLLYQGARDRFTIRQGERTIRTGVQAAGWADLSDGQWGITVATREFWQQHPKSFRIQRSRIFNELWSPEWIQGETRRFWLELFTRKTHVLWWYFHRGTTEQAGVENLAKAFEHPLRPLPNLEALARSKAWNGPYLGVTQPLGPPTNVSQTLNDFNTGWKHWGKSDNPTVGGEDFYNLVGAHWQQFGVFTNVLLFQNDPSVDTFYNAAAASTLMQLDQIPAWMDYGNDESEVVFTAGPDGGRGRLAQRYIQSAGRRSGQAPAFTAEDYQPYALGREWNPNAGYVDVWHFRFPALSEYYYLTGDRTARDGIRMFALWNKHDMWFVHEEFGHSEAQWGWEASGMAADRGYGHASFTIGQANELSTNPVYRQQTKEFSQWLLDWMWRKKIDWASGHYVISIGGIPYEGDMSFFHAIVHEGLYRLATDVGIERARDALYGGALWALHELEPPCYMASIADCRRLRPDLLGCDPDNPNSACNCWGGLAYTWYPQQARTAFCDTDPQGREGYLDQLGFGNNEHVELLLPTAYELLGRSEFLDRATRYFEDRLRGSVISAYGGAGLHYAHPDEKANLKNQMYYYDRDIRGTTVPAPPAAVQDLAASPGPPDTVRLRWTAPADRQGRRVTAYQIRYATGQTLTEWFDWTQPGARNQNRTFWSADPSPTSLSPAAPRTRETLDIPGLGCTLERPCSFAIKSIDQTNNVSDLSNVAQFPASECTGQNGDLNCDAQINVLDLQICANVAAGTETDGTRRQRVERWRQESGAPTLPAACDALARRILTQ